MLEYREVKFGSLLHKKTILLRYTMLRKPLNLKFSKEQLDGENKSHHLACFDEKLNCIGCMVLTPISVDVCKMRQVAVAASYQGMGIGKSLTIFFEQFAKDQMFTKIELSARQVAVKFYKKNGYVTKGKLFYEVGIPHYAMYKNI